MFDFLMFVALANPRLQRSIVRFADRLLVNGTGKPNVCFAAAWFSNVPIIS
jgi:hypothetical protein